jgi:hypothetical protein
VPFVLSIEEECLTVVGRSAESAQAVGRFLQQLGQRAPCLPGGNGLFNPYGRAYEDIGGHLEFAALECDSPLALAGALETQYGLAAGVARRLRDDGVRFQLANTKHSGLLQKHTPVWGLHENYLIEAPAQELAEGMLPFLATRLYGGTGGLVFPGGEWVAGVRALFMERDTGGSTTSARALFSTAREQHHMGPRPTWRRLHLISGDAHRSQYNLVLMLGATALVLKVVQSDRRLPERVARLGVRGPNEPWVGVLQRLNQLCGPGEEPRVHRDALAVQHLYLEAAEEYCTGQAAQEGLPAWTELVLAAWRRTLEALAQDERDWLGRRLDAWIKRDYLEAVLLGEGWDWRSLPGHKQRCSLLALHDHGYHAIGDERSVFDRLEEAGELEHRLVPRLPAGTEPEPFVPAVGTRARARARFLKEHAGEKELLMDWEQVLDRKRARIKRLHDPFAQAYGEWEGLQAEDLPASLRGRNMEEVLVFLRGGPPPPPEPAAPPGAPPPEPPRFPAPQGEARAEPARDPGPSSPPPAAPPPAEPPAAPEPRPRQGTLFPLRFSSRRRRRDETG